MDDKVVSNRRINLRAWAESNSIPVKEKSLFSQLMGKGSFGERVARRIESQYGIPFLDSEPGATRNYTLIAEPGHYDDPELLVALRKLRPTRQALLRAQILDEAAQMDERKEPAPKLQRTGTDQS